MKDSDIDEIFKKILEYMTRKYRRVLPVRVDFRFPEDYEHDGNNTEIRRLHKRLEQHYRDRGAEVRYQTVREQLSSETPHYHSIFLADGDKVHLSIGLKKKCNEIWKDVVKHPDDGLVHYCKPKRWHKNTERLRMINRPPYRATGADLEQRQREFDAAKKIACKHAEYLNKPDGKGVAPRRIREMLASQVRKKKR